MKLAEENKENSQSVWSVQGIWNEELILSRENRKLEPRDHIWASELGKSHYERYLKMNAIAPDFDYDERTLRKFEAGNFFERIIGFVLMSSGLLKYDNRWYQIPADDKHLAISVKPDFIAGGQPNWERVEQEIGNNSLFNLMPNLARISRKLVRTLSDKYPNGLQDLVYEIKSVNSQVFWAKKDYLSQAYPHHQLQCFAEMKATNLPEGRILYISKDDLTVAEFSLSLRDGDLSEKYEEDVAKMTEHIQKGVEPPKPESIIFDPQRKLKFQYLKERRVIKGCYVENWEVSWSNYISRITGIQGKTQSEVVAKWKNKIARELKEKNEVLKNQFKVELEDKK